MKFDLDIFCIPQAQGLLYLKCGLAEGKTTKVAQERALANGHIQIDAKTKGAHFENSDTLSLRTPGGFIRRLESALSDYKAGAVYERPRALDNFRA
jgi:hypothetical protein